MPSLNSFIVKNLLIYFKKIVHTEDSDIPKISMIGISRDKKYFFVSKGSGAYKIIGIKKLIFFNAFEFFMFLSEKNYRSTCKSQATFETECLFHF